MNDNYYLCYIKIFKFCILKSSISVGFKNTKFENLYRFKMFFFLYKKVVNLVHELDLETRIA